MYTAPFNHNHCPPARLLYLWHEQIPEDVKEEMCQLVKANSIEGCKKASVKVVYTPWSNLHKDQSTMKAGAVGFHSSADRRLRTVDKDRGCVKRLEKVACRSDIHSPARPLARSPARPPSLPQSSARTHALTR